VTDYNAQEFERFAFTPHGEIWQESSLDTLNKVELLFTGKQVDAETGWYNFGARYLDPKTGIWLSSDPALGEYIPRAPLTKEDKEANGKLPGNGGIYNPVNFALYHFAGNNPIRYTDPDGRFDRSAAVAYAREWALGRNPDFTMRQAPYGAIVQSNDCANFASQSLNAGGISTRSDWFNGKGQFGILGNRTDKNFSQNWTTASGLASFLRNTPGLLASESILPEGSTQKDVKSLIDSGKVAVGDIVGFSESIDGKDIHHVGMVTGIKDGTILFSEHTNDAKDKPLPLNTGDKAIVIFHIADDAK
jgi:RHS repeat-associated protein